MIKVESYTRNKKTKGQIDRYNEAKAKRLARLKNEPVGATTVSVVFMYTKPDGYLTHETKIFTVRGDFYKGYILELLKKEFGKDVRIMRTEFTHAQ